MNKDYLCKCNHPFSYHTGSDGFCTEGWLSHMPGCECAKFDKDNLRFLEEEYERTSQKS
jgi:hypothetical protein